MKKLGKSFRYMIYTPSKTPCVKNNVEELGANALPRLEASPSIAPPITNALSVKYLPPIHITRIAEK
jgi:hypothetical protein